MQDERDDDDNKMIPSVNSDSDYIYHSRGRWKSSSLPFSPVKLKSQSHTPPPAKSESLPTAAAKGYCISHKMCMSVRVCPITKWSIRLQWEFALIRTKLDWKSFPAFHSLLCCTDSINTLRDTRCVKLTGTWRALISCISPDLITHAWNTFSRSGVLCGLNGIGEVTLDRRECWIWWMDEKRKNVTVAAVTWVWLREGVHVQQVSATQGKREKQIVGASCFVSEAEAYMILNRILFDKQFQSL